MLAGALFGATGVALGAWGTHGLAAAIEGANTDAWDTAVLYQLIHGLVLLILAMLGREGMSGALRTAICSVLVGVILFSGSIYALVLGAPSWMGPVTPLGGVALIFGWVALVVAAVRIK